MSLSITNTNKNNLSISNVDKDDAMTWEESDPLTWDDDTGIWAVPKKPLAKDSKNNLLITNTSKL